MSAGQGDGARRPLRHRKTRDRALVLPLVGFILLMPPVASIFQIDARFAGVPFTAAYLFIVWAALIGGAALLSRRLRASVEPHGHGGGEQVDGPNRGRRAGD